jgi:hypothetical protein
VDLLEPDALAGLNLEEVRDYATRATDSLKEESGARQKAEAETAEVQNRLDQHLIQGAILAAAEKHNAYHAPQLLAVFARRNPRPDANGNVTIDGLHGGRVTADAGVQELRDNPGTHHLFKDLLEKREAIPIDPKTGKPDPRKLTEAEYIEKARGQFVRLPKQR